MQYSVAFASEVDSWKWAKRAEELGFHAAWFYDTQLLNPDVFICMALAAYETSRIRLGTGVLVPSNRIEPVTANAFASLNKLAPGRIDFGIGTGFTARRTMGQGAVPLGRTRRYIETVQGMLGGETVEWQGEDGAHKVRFLDPELGLINVEDDIPLWVSAFGPKARALTAELGAGWLNFGTANAANALDDMRASWQSAGQEKGALEANLFFLGAVLTGNDAEDEARLMAQAAPFASVMFHNLADEVGAMGGSNVETGPLGNLLAEYLKTHEQYEPADARYLNNHKGHLMYVRPDESHITPDLARAMTLSGTPDELVDQIRGIRDAGYTQLTVQLVHGHESALEDWAAVFESV
ncbi:MAG: LLM class flavin-dependent oxidoreductase [Gammaproteobacteria bacterium]|nr:MAG: LLM class flavin-dependent oxidoreductase [Gammaproteobacteria bacterium]